MTNTFINKKNCLKMELYNAFSTILIFFKFLDVTNTYTIFSVIVCFINKQERWQNIILGLCKVINKYINENIIAILFKVFKNYIIGSNIRYFIADNIDLNNIYTNVIL